MTVELDHFVHNRMLQLQAIEQERRNTLLTAELRQ
jgi:hypothetical protein